MTVNREEIARLRRGYVLSHPARVSIVKYLRQLKRAYIRQIAQALGLSDRLVSFHLSMLASERLVKSEYGLSNPGTNPPRVVRYYELTDEVNQVLADLLADLKE